MPKFLWMNCQIREGEILLNETLASAIIVKTASVLNEESQRSEYLEN